MKKIFALCAFYFIVGSLFAQSKGVLKDTRNNKVYQTVKIGDAVWMAQNLAFKTNGGCYYPKNNKEYLSKYGYLYSWETALKACPKGWDLPSKEDWLLLIDVLGGDDGCLPKLKSPFDWEEDDFADLYPISNNESGFRAKPGGYGHAIFEPDYSFDEVDNICCFWSRTPENEYLAYWIRIPEVNSFILMEGESKSNAGSVRCIKKK